MGSVSNPQLHVITSSTDSIQRSPVIFAILALYALVASAVQTLKVEGSNFVNSVNGNQFQIIGVAYV